MKIQPIKIKKLKEEEKLWLNELYSSFKENKYGNYTKLKRKLWNKLPENFDPLKIDPNLARSSSITPIGIEHIDPNYEIFKKIDKLILGFKKALIEKYEDEEIPLSYLVKSTGINEIETEKLLNLIIRTSNSQEFRNMLLEKKDEEHLLSFRSPFLIELVLKYSNINKFIKEQFIQPKTLKPQSKQPQQIHEKVTAKEIATYTPNTAFIMMWMDEKSKPELQDISNAIKEVFDKFQIKANRVDDFEHQDVITSLVLEKIKSSEFLIADLSGERPNVYYEVGYAHAINKRPILFKKEGTKLHFDLSVHNVPEYKNITHLKKLLKNRLEHITGRKIVR